VAKTTCYSAPTDFILLIDPEGKTVFTFELTPVARAETRQLVPHAGALRLPRLGMLCGALACAACRPPVSASPRERPVVVAIVVDQLSAWAADERIPLLPRAGFFARMRREGAWVHALRYPYAETDTGPGHASLYTGVVPAESGIILNEIPRPDGSRLGVLVDPRTKLVTPRGVVDAAGSSAWPLLVPTVADRLRATRPDAIILSVSLKDRAALLPAGQRPSHALWFDTQIGSFVTSTAIEPTFPAWAARVGNRAAVEAARAKVWEPTDRGWLAAHAGADDAPGEGDLDGLGTTFPHVARTNGAFRATPESDAMILDLALAGIRAEARADAPLLVLLSFSASDVIGHTFGPTSWEAWDQLRKLDAALARFLDALEARVGRARVLVTGDHGSIPAPEARDPGRPDCATPNEMHPWCFPGGRIDPAALTATLRAAGGAENFAGVADGYVFLTEAGRAARMDATVRAVALALPNRPIAEAYSAADLAARCPEALRTALGVPARAGAVAGVAGEEPLLTLVCRSWHPGRGGDVLLVPARGWAFDTGSVRGKGSGHGTPYLYDRTVPLLVRGGDMASSRDVAPPVDFTAFAGVLMSFLDLEPTSAANALARATAAR
jgi:hypothetical protein